ncbi:MAG: transporter [Nocardia sp.]|uniref:hypothetical protein n=1 Tax=Nocardia sp. TaxID=1821 RepID=UPI00262A56DA|nr:hypothetical protein [Nocardia sp.]MCU1640438.1 transporter [Nocardia sp.]
MYSASDRMQAVTLFVGAMAASSAIELPTKFRWATRENHIFQIERLILSAPRAAAIGVIVAVMVAVFAYISGRATIVWWAALVGTLIVFVNHIGGQYIWSHDLTLPSLNYVDSISGGVALGALGATAQRKLLPMFGFALGGCSAFVAGDLTGGIDLFGRNPLSGPSSAGWTPVEEPPIWLLAAALLLIAACTWRARPDFAAEPTAIPVLPPIIAAVAVALGALFSAEWLAGRNPGPVEIGIAVLGTVVPAMIAATLLPGRDGSGLLMVVGIAAAAGAVGVSPQPEWIVPVLIILAGVGLVVGARRPSVWISAGMTLAVAVFTASTAASYGGGRTVVLLGGAVLAFAVGHLCASARPQQVPSGVLLIAALALPTCVTAIRTSDRAGYPNDPRAAFAAAPSLAAGAIILCCMAGVALLHSRRPALSR